VSAFTTIKLERLESPDVIQALNFETILAEMLADLRARDAAYSAIVESDPAYKILEVCAYRALLLLARVNDAARKVMLAYARGTDLEHLGALFGVQRLPVTAADPNASPPVEAVYEDDSRFRYRIQLSLEAFTTAGSKGAYEFWALSASARVKDVDVASPQPGEVVITVLSTAGDGTPDQDLLDAVFAALSAEDVRPLTDHVTVQAATVWHYALAAKIYTYSGPDPEVVRQAALDAVTEYVADNHLLGHNIEESGLHAAMHQPGVQRVEIFAPDGGRINVESQEAAYCESISLTYAGVDE